ncbi:MAG: very short patch repair endonuclease [Verrucomicrobiota bacterium]
MADIVSEEQRSYNMSRIRSKNTKPELVVRSMLHRLGYRFTVNGPKNKKLPGKPDIVLPKYKTVIFVHGCFWHMCPGCKYATIPKTRMEWWKAKLEGNAKRDARKQKELRQLGWRVVVVWQCELRSPVALSLLETDLVHRIEV